jgi:hypothetical protein
MLLRALHNRLGSPWKFTVEALGYYVHVRGITEKEGLVGRSLHACRVTTNTPAYFR